MNKIISFSISTLFSSIKKTSHDPIFFIIKKFNTDKNLLKINLRVEVLL
nr:hypothetical protein [Candidatus Profftella armatura (Diaphorina cf. continua)]